jgi:hypothetical protein
MSNEYDARRLLLRDIALDVGKRWFDRWRAQLVGEGRCIEGGWPGTIKEARALVAASIRLPNVTSEELGWAARTSWAEAKRAWLSSEDRRRQSDPGSA